MYYLISFYQRIVELWCHAKNFPNAPRTYSMTLRFHRKPQSYEKQLISGIKINFFSSSNSAKYEIIFFIIVGILSFIRMIILQLTILSHEISLFKL